MQEFHATTVISVRRNGIVAIGGDGQVTLGDTVMKGNAMKVRRRTRRFCGCRIRCLCPV